MEANENIAEVVRPALAEIQLDQDVVAEAAARPIPAAEQDIQVQPQQEVDIFLMSSMFGRFLFMYVAIHEVSWLPSVKRRE